ncbi:hypothetical protein [Streptomyces sp. NPDC047130]|uniref:hypothetical protein n=1 Tax=Streptomyces sp. NPDC047130 TaxID=3155261 RepID=UPI00340226C2
MTAVDPTAWRGRLDRLASPTVTEAVVVQCGTDWLRPEQVAFRNEVDRAVLAAQLARGPALTVHRVVLQNLPVGRPTDIDPRAMDDAFDEWNHRLASSIALLRTRDHPVPRIHRLIIQGDQAGAPVPDMVEIREAGRWSSPQRAAQALGLFTGADSGNTTPMTSYDVGLDGPFGDADPSVHM